MKRTKKSASTVKAAVAKPQAEKPAEPKKPLKEVPPSDKELLKDIEPMTPGSMSPEKQKRMIIVTYVVLVLLGVGTGFLLARGGSGQTAIGGAAAPNITKTDKVAGSDDTDTFNDIAEGVLQKGGLDGEGSHNLEREGGPSQTAYLTSSYVDLDAFVGKKVKVWGQTVAAEKAPWLMDVGRVEVLSE